MKIPFDKCEIKFYCDDIPLKGIGYAVVAKYPAKYRKAILEYVLHTILEKQPDKVMVGFKHKQHRKLHFEEFSIKHIHNMITMQKKLSDICFDYDASLKFKRISDTFAKQYIELYKNIFWNVPNASFYSEDEIIKLLHRTDYEICFVYYKRVLVGFCEYSITHEKAIIEAIGVIDEYRGIGMAKKILWNLYYLFSNENVHSIELTASTKNIPAITLYKKEGFRKRKTLSYWYEICH